MTAFGLGAGLPLALLGSMILSGVDKIVEAWLVQVSPAWLTTRF